MVDRPDTDPLAELDADVAAGLPVDEGAHAEALADPASRDVLAALAATRAELAAVPPVPVPPDLAARWSAALAAEASGHESAPPAPSRPTAANDRARRSVRAPGSRPSRAGRLRWRTPRPALLVGLALVTVLVVAGALHARPAPPAVTAAALGGVARAAVGTNGAGELADTARRVGCLSAVAARDLSPDAPLLGGRDVVFEGRPGVLLVLATGRLGSFRVVVVDPSCGPGGGTLLADTRIGR